MEGLENGCKTKKELYLSVHYAVKDSGLQQLSKLGFLCATFVFSVSLW